MIIKASITFGLLLCSFFLFSQTKTEPAFMVTYQNDTLFGVGSMSSNQDYCIFRKINGKEFISYYPKEIRVFRFIDGKYFVSEEIKDPDNKLRKYFLEFLVDGEIDLFAISATNRYFIKKDSAGLLELNDNLRNLQEINGSDYLVQDKRYLGYIRAYMAEAPQLFTEIDKMRKLNQKDLVELSVEYHHAVCNEYECVNYTKKILNVRTKVELVTGVTRHNDYYTPKVGVLFHLPIKDNNFYIKTGILFGDRSFRRKGYFDKEETDYSLKIPVSLEYIFGSKNFRPTIGIGWPTGVLGFSEMFPISSLEAGFIYTIQQSWEVSISGSVDGLMSYALDEQYFLFNTPLGHSLSFGIIYNFGPK
ncbi:MAG TPA: hypothetical protein VK172_01235 [Lentimicrobium sp.]|nr:hypothetical protein [Lentimicrobium sp.]